MPTVNIEQIINTPFVTADLQTYKYSLTFV